MNKTPNMMDGAKTKCPTHLRHFANYAVQVGFSSTWTAFLTVHLDTQSVLWYLFDTRLLIV